MLLIASLSMVQLSAMQQAGSPNDTFSELTTSIYNTDDCCDDVPTRVNVSTKPEKAVTNKAVAKMQAGIVGRWENTIYPFEIDDAGVMPGAYLRYDFSSTGEYTKVIGSTELSYEESGQWEIEDDGQTLRLTSSTGKITLAMIKHLQLDELVLEQELKVKNAAFCTKQKDFFFNKQ